MDVANPGPPPVVPPAVIGPKANPIEETDDRIFFLKKRFSVTALVLAIIFYLLFWQWLIGVYHYQWHYIRAALGDDALQTACAGVKNVKNPWHYLYAHEWYTLQACLGNEAGYERQGELLGVLGDFLKYLWGLTQYLGPLPTLLGGVLFIKYIIIDSFDRVESLIIHTRPVILPRIAVGGIALTVVFTLFYFPIRVFAAVLLFVAMIPPAIYLYGLNLEKEKQLDAGVFSEILQSWQPIQKVFVSVVKYTSQHMMMTLDIIERFSDRAASASTFKYCYHVETCHCDRKGNKYLALEMRLQAANAEAATLQGSSNLYQAENRRLNEILENFKDQRLRKRGNGGATADLWNTVSPTSDYSGGAGVTEYHRREVAVLQKSLTDFRNEKRASEKRLELIIRNLKAQLSYATGEGNALAVKEEADSLKAQLRIMTKERNQYQLEAMHSKIDLQKAFEDTTRKCKNEARCSMRIRELERDKQLLLDQHRANDLMVQDAAREFGKSEQEAKRYTLRIYLQEITQAMVAQIAAGGLGNFKNQPAFKNILNAMDRQRIKELEGYKNRLEDEVQRLGGNVQIMRLGLDPKLPKPFRELTYENHAKIVFPVYTELCILTQSLTDLITSHNMALEPWTHPPPRSDINNRRMTPCVDMLEHRPIMAKNHQFEQYEIFLQSLLREEVSRLLNRLVVLRTSCMSMALSTNTALYTDKVVNTCNEAFIIIIKATKVMDDVRPLEKRDTNIEDAALAARAERRFKIWRAMQEAIESEVNAIESFNSIVPGWRVQGDKPIPDFLPVKTFEDLVARLVKYEINTVEDRMMQLFEYMEDQRIPGTSKGQPRIQGSPDYQANWDAVQAARTYALLCRDHWYDECNPNAPRRIRLPLDHPPILHALRREKGDVLVSLQNPFPWKLSKGGVLQDARVVEVMDQNVESHPEVKKVVVVEDGVATQKWELPILDDNDGPLTDASGNLIMSEFKVEKSWYEKHYNRVKQLRAYIDVSNRPMVHPKGALWVTKQDSAVNMALMKAKKMELYNSCNELEYYMMDNGLKVPEWPHRGGVIEPPAGYGGSSGDDYWKASVMEHGSWKGMPDPNARWGPGGSPASYGRFLQPTYPDPPPSINPGDPPSKPLPEDFTEASAFL